MAVRGSLVLSMAVVVTCAGCILVRDDGRDRRRPPPFDAGPADAPGPRTDGGPPAAARSASASISAFAGGIVTLDDGTRVDVPPSALAADTVITVTRTPLESETPTGVVASVRLEPEGLVFAQPVLVTIPYDPTGIEDEADLVVSHTSTVTELRDVGGERSASEELLDVVREPGRITAAITHFSVIDVFWLPKLFVAPAIPGRYLRSGDILYTLTGGESYSDAWTLPIHVGMFVQDAQHDRVYEATTATAGCNSTDGVVEGRYHGDCGLLSLLGQHIFIGARRPRGGVTVEQGERAVVAARRSLGLPYGVSGLPSRTVGTGTTCVQLTEDAWEEAGVNISSAPDILLTPYAQYDSTVAVDTISVNAQDGEVRIPIVVAVRTTDIASLSAHSYTAAGTGRVEATLTLSADDMSIIDSGRARLEPARPPPGERFGAQAVQDLVFRPIADDVGFSYRFDLRIEVPSRGIVRDVSRVLRIEVGGEPGEECTLPMPRTWSGTLSGRTDGGDFSIVLPSEYLRAALSEFPAGDPFPLFAFYTVRRSDGLDIENGDLYIYGELPSRPLGGMTYEIPLPRDSKTFPDWYFQTPEFDCTVGGSVLPFGERSAPDGSIRRGEIVTGSMTLSFSRDCATLTLAASLSGVRTDGARCTYSGNFVGTAVP